MNKSLYHRGPDGGDLMVEENIGLAHRRLSIIDIENGAQPMSSRDGQLSIVFNGEIYNYIELRSELINYGYQFKTSSDTEVILHAYSQWGDECWNHLNGMWAIALYDRLKKRLVLCRDRIGEKPLYYFKNKELVCFASEIQAIGAFGIELEPAVEYTELYFSLGYIPDPYTFYKDLYKLAPGHFLIVEREGVTLNKYWDVPIREEKEMITDELEVLDTFTELFTDSVRIRMRTDVDFGALLSGGLDSSTIVGIMSGLSALPINTFTIGNTKRELDESDLASHVARRFKSNHTVEYPEIESFDYYLKLIVDHYNEPFGDSSAIPTGIISKVARSKVKVVLTGDGGDEVLSGYSAYQSEKFASFMKPLPSALTSIPSSAIGALKFLFSGTSLSYRANGYKNAFALASASFEERLYQKSSRTARVHIDALANHNSQYTFREFIADTMRNCPYSEPFYKLMFWNFKVSLPGDMLVKVDRMSMAHSLETRAPFLDHRLVEFMSQVDKSVKMKFLQRKSVLRKSFGHMLPKDILRAPKKGFRAPVRDWFKSAAFDNKLQGLINSNHGLSREVIKSLIDENRSGYADNGTFIWMLFVYSEWLKKNEELKG
jgi:asparagine synthase (glutamine-hydrolysing)